MKKNNYYWRFLPPFVIYAAIFYLSSRPASSFPDVAPDYVPHFIEYFILAFFFIRIFAGKINGKIILTSIAVLLAAAVLDEVHQYYVPTRFFEIKDILVDLTGIIAGVFSFKFLNRTCPAINCGDKEEIQGRT